MSKCDLAFKLAGVKAYENGEGGYGTLVNQFNIVSDSTVCK